MPRRSYFQPGGVFRALHLIPLRCTAHAHSALLFHSFSRYTWLNWINQSERTRKKWRANHCAGFQEQLIRSRVCWRIIGIKDWPIRGKGLKELTNQRKPGRLFKGMFWWKNQLLGGVPLGLQTLSSTVYQLAILYPPASLAGSQNSVQIAIIFTSPSVFVDLPASYPDRWIPPQQIRIVHK